MAGSADGQLQRIPLRHRRPPLLFEVEGSRRSWHEILPHDFIERPRLSRIYYGGKYYSYPLNAFEAVANLGLFTSARPACFVSPTPRISEQEHATFHEWVRNQFGERLFSIFFKTYTEKVWGMSCDEISADWAAQRIKGLDLGVAVMNALRRRCCRGGQAESRRPVVKTLIESSNIRDGAPE